MGVKMYTPEAKLSKIAAVKRVCSHCQKTWAEEVKIEATGRGASSYFTPDEREAIKAKENAYKQLKQKEETTKKELGADKRVLCRSCNHFSTDAMAKHFPDGFLAGFMKKLMRAYWTALLLVIPCGVGGAFLRGGFYLKRVRRIQPSALSLRAFLPCCSSRVLSSISCWESA